MASRRVPVVEISREKMDEILDSPGATYEPRGLFLSTECVGGVAVYTAMRNLNGEGLTEDFTTHVAAVRWLHNFPVTERYIYKPLTMDRVARIVEGMAGNGEGAE